jgi:hypothetical protein
MWSASWMSATSTYDSWTASAERTVERRRGFTERKGLAGTRGPQQRRGPKLLSGHGRSRRPTSTALGSPSFLVAPLTFLQRPERRRVMSFMSYVVSQQPRRSTSPTCRPRQTPTAKGIRHQPLHIRNELERLVDRVRHRRRETRSRSRASVRSRIATATASSQSTLTTAGAGCRSSSEPEAPAGPAGGQFRFAGSYVLVS